MVRSNRWDLNLWNVELYATMPPTPTAPPYRQPPSTAIPPTTTAPPSRQPPCTAIPPTPTAPPCRQTPCTTMPPTPTHRHTANLHCSTSSCAPLLSSKPPILSPTRHMSSCVRCARLVRTRPRQGRTFARSVTPGCTLRRLERARAPGVKYRCETRRSPGCIVQV